MLEIMEEFREGEGYEKKRLVYSLCYYISYVMRLRRWLKAQFL